MESQAALEQKVFNLKLRVHEYELRLQQVDLHGVTGEQLQRENQELKEKLLTFEQKNTKQQEQIESLTMICMKVSLQICICHHRDFKSTTDSNCYRRFTECKH